MSANTITTDRDDSRREEVRVLTAAYRGMLEGFEKSVTADLRRLRRMAKVVERWAARGGRVPTLAKRYDAIATHTFDQSCTCSENAACSACKGAKELAEFGASLGLDVPLFRVLELIVGRRQPTSAATALAAIQSELAGYLSNAHVVDAMMEAGLAAAGLDPSALDVASADPEVHSSRRPQLQLIKGGLSD